MGGPRCDRCGCDRENGYVPGEPCPDCEPCGVCGHTAFLHAGCGADHASACDEQACACRAFRSVYEVRPRPMAIAILVDAPTRAYIDRIRLESWELAIARGHVRR